VEWEKLPSVYALHRVLNKEERKIQNHDERQPIDTRQSHGVGCTENRFQAFGPSIEEETPPEALAPAGFPDSGATTPRASM